MPRQRRTQIASGVSHSFRALVEYPLSDVPGENIKCMVVAMMVFVLQQGADEEQRGARLF